MLAYAVSQRTHEIGIRLALGASRGDVVKMILRQGLALAFVGGALGWAGAYVLTKFLESRLNVSQLLYGIRPHNPLTYGVMAGLLTLVGLSACWLPARRAARVDPLVVRDESKNG